MVWDEGVSDRTRRLPDNWPKIVRQVKHRDGHQCRWRLPSGKRCPRGRATGHVLHVDHRKAGDDHRLANLQALCEEHHNMKSSREGLKAQRLPDISRRKEVHPFA